MSANDPKQSKSERQQAARDNRKQAEQAEAAAAARKKRTWQLGGIVAIAIAVVAGVAIAGSSGGGADLKAPPNGAKDVNALFAGVPQAGASAGKANAPLTLVEYADLKCPVCRDFDVNAMPTIIQRYVRTGKLRIEIHLLHFVGEQQNPGDSEKAARFAVAAGDQGKQWGFVELFYFNQQDETTRYVTDDYLKWLAKPIPGLDADKALKDSGSKLVTAKLDAYSREFAGHGFTGTPSFLIGSTGGTLLPLVPSGGVGSPESFTTQIDTLLQGK
jgi:protein-disulfide isomerase